MDKYIYIYIIHNSVRELQVGFQAVEFLRSEQLLYKMYKSCYERWCFRRTTCLEAIGTGKKGHVLCNKNYRFNKCPFCEKIVTKMATLNTWGY